jgi:hypothetical protein
MFLDKFSRRADTAGDVELKLTGIRYLWIEGAGAGLMLVGQHRRHGEYATLS